MKLKKLGSLGAAHIILPLLVVVGAGIVGTYMLVASHADSTLVSCSYNGHTYSGHREYNCSFSLPTPVISSNREVGTFHLSSTNWVLCQQESTVTYTKSAGIYNRWWAYTISDQGTAGWVNATYATTGANNGQFANVPLCSLTTGLQSVVPTLPTLSSGTGVTWHTVYNNVETLSSWGGISTGGVSITQPGTYRACFVAYATVAGPGSIDVIGWANGGPDYTASVNFTLATTWHTYCSPQKTLYSPLNHVQGDIMVKYSSTSGKLTTKQQFIQRLY